MTSSKDMLKSMDMNVYWDKVAAACAADDYARSKQQQDNRSEACLIVYNARKALALQKGNSRVRGQRGSDSLICLS